MFEFIALSAVVAIVYGVGVAIGIAGNPGTVTPVDVTDPESCKKACEQWDGTRQGRCNAEKDETTARLRVDGLRSTFNSLLVTATALFAAAGGAALIPFIGTAIAAGLLIAAAGVSAAALVVAGMLGAAETDLASKANNAHDWRVAEGEARAKMLEVCPMDEATHCLGLPSPC